MFSTHWMETQTVKVWWKDMEYTAIVRIEKHNEPNYGSDRDGNRGMSRDFIDNTEIEEIVDIEGRPLNKIPAHLEEEIYKEVQ